MLTQTLGDAKLLDALPMVAWLFMEVMQSNIGLKLRQLCASHLERRNFVGSVMVYHKLLVYNLLHEI